LKENRLFDGAVTTTMTPALQSALARFAEPLGITTAKGDATFVDALLTRALNALNSRYEYDRAKSGAGAHLVATGERPDPGTFRYRSRTGSQDWETDLTFEPDGRCTFAHREIETPSVTGTWQGRCELVRWISDGQGRQSVFVFIDRIQGGVRRRADYDRVMEAVVRRHRGIPSFSFERDGELLLLSGEVFRPVAASVAKVPAAPPRKYRHLTVAPGIPEWGYECLAPIDAMLVRLRELELAEDDVGVARTIRKVFDAWKSKVYGIPDLAEATAQREDFTANLRRYRMEILDHSAKFYMSLNDDPDQATIHHRNERLAEVQVVYTTFALESVTCIENRHRAAR